ncbi:TraR/DksA C4-type zinc finger protein [Candidatus Sumerlaeota bacterium]|nr:TraR/DksA C4-type zinc finger protein [Candidatus Sumerlaeota bacterium]
MKKTTVKKGNPQKGKIAASPRKTSKAAKDKVSKKIAQPVKKATKKASVITVKASKTPSRKKDVKSSRVKIPAKSKTRIKSVKPDSEKLIKEIKSHQSKKSLKFSKSELNHLQEELTAEKNRLIKELESLDDITHTNGSDDTSEVRAYSIHMAENASEIEAVNTALGLRKIIAERLSQINEALERLSEGNYGICQRCGNAINMERLLAKPQAVFCVDCRRIVEAEKRGVI